MAVDTIIFPSNVWSAGLRHLLLIPNRAGFHGVAHEPVLPLRKLPHHLCLPLPCPSLPRLCLLLLLSLLCLRLSRMLRRPHLGPAHLDELLAGHVQFTDLVKHLFYEKTSVPYSTVSIRLAAGTGQFWVLPPLIKG